MEPIIPIDLINHDLIKIKDKGNGYGMFTYSNPTLNEFELKILAERVQIIYDPKYLCLYLKSEDLKFLEKTLEKMIHVYKGSELAKRDERSKKIKINLTPNSNVTFIYKDDEKKYNKKEKIGYTQLKMMLEKGHDIASGCLVNIIIKPIICTKSNYVRFDVVYCDIFKHFLSNTGQIYNKLETLQDVKLREKIIL